MQLDSPYMDAWDSLVRIHNRVIARLDADLAKDAAISLTWYNILSVLADSPELRLRMSEIADRIVLSRSALTRSMDKLVAAGLIARETCPEDERGAYGSLTSKGQDALRHARPIYSRGVQAYFATELTDSDTKSLKPVMDKILVCLNAASERLAADVEPAAPDIGNNTNAFDPGSD